VSLTAQMRSLYTRSQGEARPMSTRNEAIRNQHAAR
jgi:hypothetical protein